MTNQFYTWKKLQKVWQELQMPKFHFFLQYGANPSQIIYELVCSQACCVKNALRMSEAKEWVDSGAMFQFME